MTPLLWLGLTFLAAFGAWQVRSVVRADTLLLTRDDRAAMDWIKRQTPTDASFLITTAHWHLGTYRGLDGGYWIPMLADRKASVPAALYVYGEPEDVIETGAIAEQASRGDELSDAELAALLDRAGAGWVYVGPASAGRAEAFSAERLRRQPALVERYDAGGVTIFERAPAARDGRR